MKLEDGFRELLAEAAELGARRALEKSAASPRRLLPLREAGVSYRLLLDAERRGELRVHRRGHAAFVALDELERWIVTSPAASSARPPTEPVDEIGALIDFGNKRRSRRGRVA